MKPQKCHFLPLLALACALPAHAHVTLEQRAATAGSTYKAVFRVGHGCAGSATTRISVFLPPGIDDAKPMPKPGWTLERRNEASPPKTDAHGKLVSQRTAVVSWRGGPLADDEYDEFVLRASLPATPGRLYFRVLQECEHGENDWAAIASPDDKPAFPAAVLDLTPPPATPSHAH